MTPAGSVMTSLLAREKVLVTRITVAQEKEQVMSPEKQVRTCLAKCLLTLKSPPGVFPVPS